MCQRVKDGRYFSPIGQTKVYYSSSHRNIHEDEVEENLVSLLDLSDIFCYFLLRSCRILSHSLWFHLRRLHTRIWRQAKYMVVSLQYTYILTTEYCFYIMVVIVCILFTTVGIYWQFCTRSIVLPRQCSSAKSL